MQLPRRQASGWKDRIRQGHHWFRGGVPEGAEPATGDVQNPPGSPRRDVRGGRRRHHDEVPVTTTRWTLAALIGAASAYAALTAVAAATIIRCGDTTDLDVLHPMLLGSAL